MEIVTPGVTQYSLLRAAGGGLDTLKSRSRTNVPDVMREWVFEAAWIAHQQCCFWSLFVMQDDEVRTREKEGELA